MRLQPRRLLILLSLLVLVPAGLTQMPPGMSSWSAVSPAEADTVSASVDVQAVIAASKVVKYLDKDYGAVTSAALNRAIADARGYFQTTPDAVYAIILPAGSFAMPDTIDVSGVTPGPKGRLIIAGQGKALTTIVQAPNQTGIAGKDVNRVTFQGLHFTLPIQTTTQGHVVSVSANSVVLDISPGFPSPQDLMDKAYAGSRGCEKVAAAVGGWGRYLKILTDSKTDPHMDNVDQQKVSFCLPQPVAGVPGRWAFSLKDRNSKEAAVSYPVGGLIAVKSKFMESAYQFCGGDDFEFKDIIFTQRSRGTWRCGFNHVHLDGVQILRPAPIQGQVPALSSPGGGPQIGEVGTPSTGHLIENSLFVGTGDDAIAFFDASGVVRDTTVQDSWGRVNLNQSPGVDLTNTQVIRTRVVRQ